MACWSQLFVQRGDQMLQACLAVFKLGQRQDIRVETDQGRYELAALPRELCLGARAQRSQRNEVVVQVEGGNTQRPPEHGQGRRRAPSPSQGLGGEQALLPGLDVYDPA
jgi:hypothetical protein